MRFEFVRTKVDEACLSHWALYSLVTRQTRAEEGHRLPAHLTDCPRCRALWKQACLAVEAASDERLPAAIADSRRGVRPRQITWTTGSILVGLLATALFAVVLRGSDVDQTSRLKGDLAVSVAVQRDGHLWLQETPVEKTPRLLMGDRMMFRVYSAPATPLRLQGWEGESAGWVTYFEGLLPADGWIPVGVRVTDGRDTKLRAALCEGLTLEQARADWMQSTRCRDREWSW